MSKQNMPELNNDLNEGGKKIMRKIRSTNQWRMIAFPSMLMYLELVFHMIIFKNIDSKILYPLLSGAVFGLLLGLFACIFRDVGNVIIGYLGLTIFCVYDIVQLIYYRIFGTFLSLVSVGGAENAMNFKVVLFRTLRENIVYMILLMVPVFALVLLQIKFVSFERPNRKCIIIHAIITPLLGMLAILLLNIHGRAPYSPYQLFHNRYVLELSMKQLGVTVTTIRDAESMRAGENQDVKFSLDEETDERPDNASEPGIQQENGQTTGEQTSGGQTAAGQNASGTNENNQNANNNNNKNNMNEQSYSPQIDASIDFKALYHATEDERIRNICAFCSKRQPTLKNEYTGIFEDYNVVFITAESLYGYGIYKQCTPTLYKLMNEGFVFENYYNPMWYHSTIDGEYVNCLGQYPCASDWSFYKSAQTSQPYALGNALNKKGYTSKAYHDFDFYYYNRSETHANMGYDFKAIDYGLDIPYFGSYSDVDMMEAVCSEFINEEKFLAYFMTFSGHLPYNYQDNPIPVKNREEAERLTQGMNLPEEAVAYIATQIELDRALELLIDKLDEADKLEKTLFVITSDHYPYGLSDDAIDALANENVSESAFEKHHSCLGIWSASMEKPVVVDKLCASVDVLPTVLNLLGIDYDSRLLAGNDIMSDSEQLVIFSDHSFMTDKIRYNTKTGEITYLVDEKKIDEKYINEQIEKVENLLYISDEIINTDFFTYVYQ